MLALSFGSTNVVFKVCKNILLIIVFLNQESIFVYLFIVSIKDESVLVSKVCDVKMGRKKKTRLSWFK